MGGRWAYLAVDQRETWCSTIEADNCNRVGLVAKGKACGQQMNWAVIGMGAETECPLMKNGWQHLGIELMLRSRDGLIDWGQEFRSTDDEMGKHSVTSWTAAVQEAIGISNYDEPMDYAVHNHINEGNASVKNVIHDEDIIFVGTTECPEPKGKGIGKGKGKEVVLHEELEIPRCPSPTNPVQLFDPATYEARDFYVADSSGSMRRVPDSDIIRWSKVPKPDGTTSVESNTRFVKFSDGSLQLLIGDEASDVPEDSKKAPLDLLLEVAEAISRFHGKNF